MYTRSEGLGLSVLLYAALMLGGLAAVVVPVYLANGPTVLRNANAATGVGDTNRIFTVPLRQRFPVARLDHKPIVDPATLADLSARAERHKPAHSATVHRRRHVQPPRHAYAEVQPQPRPAYPHISAMF